MTPLDWIVALIVFAADVFGVCWWIRRGASVPKYIHILAIALTIAAIACLAVMALNGMANLKFAIGLTIGPSVGTYGLWLFMDPNLNPEPEPDSEGVVLKEPADLDQ